MSIVYVLGAGNSGTTGGKSGLVGLNVGTTTGTTRTESANYKLRSYERKGPAIRPSRHPEGAGFTIGGPVASKCGREACKSRYTLQIAGSGWGVSLHTRSSVLEVGGRWLGSKKELRAERKRVLPYPAGTVLPRRPSLRWIPRPEPFPGVDATDITFAGTEPPLANSRQPRSIGVPRAIPPML